MTVVRTVELGDGTRSVTDARSVLVRIVDGRGSSGGGGGGAVSSVFGRTGVVAAQSGDYGAFYDAAGAAAAAQLGAQNYTDTAVNTAIGAEITRANAAYDAAGAAASAQSAAIAAASTDATTKANAAAAAAEAASDPVGSAAAAQAAAVAASQPLDADLTAIALLTTTTFGRALLTSADAAALRTSAGLGTAATHPATDFDTAGAAAAAQAASQPLDSDLTAIAALATTSYGRSLLTLANQAALVTALGNIPESQVTNLTTDLAGKASTAQAIGYAIIFGGN